MEASFIEDRSISKSSCSPIELRCSEAAVFNDRQMADKCDHFTIRGYVADVRKKDAKICWPFPTLYNYSQSENAKLLPPLSMTKFKRWDCQTCRDTSIASSSAIENEEVVNTTNYERKSDNFLLLHNTPMTSYQNATTLFSGLTQPCEKNALEGRSNNTNSSINVCNAENHSSLSCGTTESESHVASQLTKEGLQICRDEHKISYQNLKQPNSSDYIAVEGDKFRTEEKGEGNTDLSAKAYDTSSLCGDVPVSNKENKVKSISVVTGSQICGNPTSKSTNVASFGIEADLLMSGMGKIVKLSDIHSGGSGMHVTTHMTDHDSVGLEDHHEESQNDLVTVIKIARNQKKENQLEKLSGKTKHKKVPKVRLLNDIMRNDKLHLLGEAEPSENIDEKMEGRSKEEARNPEHGRWFVGRKTVVNHAERRNTSDVIPNNDGQHFLTQCLKKIPNKRAITLDGYVETQTNDFPTGISQLDTNTSAGKDLGHKIEVPKVRWGKREAVVGRKKNVLPHLTVRSRLFPQQDSITVKGKASKDLPYVRMQKKYVQHDMKILDSTHQKDISSIEKRKAHQVTEEQFYQMQFPKDKVTKKRRTTRTWDKGAVDDIPMDIVELLANNLHEKCLKNAKYATKRLDYLPQVTENLKHDGVTGVVKHHINEGSEVVDHKLIQQNAQADTSRNGLWAVGTNVENAYDLQNAYHSSTICDQDRDISPNQQKIGDSSTKFHAFSDSNIFPISREDFCVTGQYENTFPQKFCHDRSNLMGQVVSYRSSGKSHDASQVLLSGETSGINGTNPKLNKLNTDTINIHLNTDQRNYFHKTSLQRSFNPTAKHPPAHKWKDGASFSGGIPTAATSVLEVDNECHSMATWPADQHTSENISALNFSAMLSDGCFPALPNTNCTRLIEESRLLRAGAGFKSIETVEHQGNSCKLVRPIPRIGILGNILQKEITNLSGNLRPQSLIKVGCFNQIMSHNISSRTAYSKWITPNVVSTSHPECSRTSNASREVEFRNKDGWVQSPSSSFGMEICVVNRNPADFTSADEQSMYMRGKECVRPGCIPTSKSQKRQANGEKLKQKKGKKLSALKLLMRG